jgi:hypothetical protein
VTAPYKPDPAKRLSEGPVIGPFRNRVFILGGELIPLTFKILALLLRLIARS